MTTLAVPEHASSVRCRICGAEGNRPVFEIDDRLSLQRCEACSVVLQEPLLSDEELAELYSTGWYADQQGRFIPGIDNVLNALTRTRMRFLRSKRPGRLLDYGSGKGRFLRVARESGWDVAGYEPFQHRAELTADGITVYGGSVDDLPPEVGGYDAITMFHVVEHLADPLAALTDVRDLLADDGTLIVALPNFDSWQSKWGRRDWLHLHAPMHLQHFTPQSLEALLNNVGFVVEEQTTWMPESNILGWFQTAVNRLSHTQEVLLLLLKRAWRPSDEQDWRDLGRAVAATAVCTLALPLLALLAGVEARAGRGAVIHVAARKA